MSGLPTVVLTALAVSMDAVAVSISSGMTRGRASWGEAFSMAVTFGAFQALMPALGYAGGAYFRDVIEAYDHWIAFGLLALVGGHMILESRGSKDEERRPGNPFTPRRLAILGVATSVDALAVGLSLSVMDMAPAVAIAVIGLTTFVLCVPAVLLGVKLGTRFAHHAEFAGGAILVAIGVNILIEHLSGAA